MIQNLVQNYNENIKSYDLSRTRSPETEKNRFFGSVSVEPTRNRKRNRKHEKTDL
jgi:hypothetical protein